MNEFALLEVARKTFPKITIKTLYDVPLFSLKDIANHYDHTMPVNEMVARHFQQILVKKNLHYRQQIQRAWDCITLRHLLESVRLLGWILRRYAGSVKDDPQSLVTEDQLYSVAITSPVAIMQWFKKYFYSLTYLPNEKMPYELNEYFFRYFDELIENQMQLFAKRMDERFQN